MMTRQEHIEHCRELLPVIPQYADKLAWLESMTDAEYEKEQMGEMERELKLKADR